jgi:hypothetical protein
VLERPARNDVPKEPHLASRFISACRRPSSVTTSTSSSSKGIDPDEEAKEAADERGGMSLSVRMELVECRLTIVGLCSGLATGYKELTVLETWVMGECLNRGRAVELVVVNLER